jgi:hypothetical protein
MLITSVDATESSVPGPEYDRFVNDILLAKTQQLRNAAAAEVVVAARPPFDNHALAQAIKRRAGDVPGNWIGVSAAIIGGAATLVWPLGGWIWAAKTRLRPMGQVSKSSRSLDV